MAKVNVDTLPTLDDFMEVDNLQGSPGYKPEKKTETPEVEEVVPEVKKEEVPAEEVKKKKEPAPVKKETPKLSEQEVNLLVQKAEEKPETLSEEERKYLLDNKLFEEEGAKVSFWEDVEAESGIKVPVEWGDVDPESPKGAAMRDQALMDIAIQNQLDYLQKTYPDAYRILEHVSNGGNVTDLVNRDEPDFSKIVLDKDDKESQKDLLLNFYLQKGFDEKDAQRYVEADEDSAEGLLSVAQKALKQLATTQQAKQNQIIEEQKLQKAEVARRNLTFKQNIKQITEAGKLGDFSIVNKKDKEEFYNFAVSNIYSDGQEGYQVVLPINEKSVIPVLQQLFFSFKNGKLDEYVKREAQTQQTRKLIRKASQVNMNTGSQPGQQQRPEGSKNLPTFDVFADNG